MADQESSKSTPGTDIPLLPWETKGTDEKSAEENLFDLLGSDPEFQEEEDLDDTDESESDESEEDEDDDTGDDEEEDESEEDEDESEEDDDSEEDEDDEDSEDEDEDSDDEPEKRPVKVDGKIIAEVTFDEAIAGYSRQSDYTRKSQANAEEQAKGMAEIGEIRGKYSEHLEQLQAVMESMTPAEPDWDAIRKEDPGEYAAQKQDHADRLSAIEKVAAERTRVGAEKQKEDNAAQAVYLQGEMGKLVEAIPEWKNEAVRATGIAGLRDFAIQTYGFSDADLDNVVDHRLLLLLHENSQNRQKTQSGKKEIRKKRKTAKKMKPGRGNKNTKSRRATRKQTERARNRLTQTGSEQDAAAVIENLLGDDD